MGIEEIRRLKFEAELPKPKKNYQIPKVSKKRQEKLNKEKEERGDDDTELVKWYRSRMKVMGTKCNECGHSVQNKIYHYAIMNICHLLPKRNNMCPSVKTHPMNFITLCPDHHSMYDNASWEEREMMGCWETVRDRLILVYPDLDENEHRHFPQSVLDYMEKHEPF